MSNTYLWKVHPLKAPRLQKKCAKCASTEFENSGYFRVNANGPRLDVWLIYKCAHCQSTWNLTIFSRIPARTLDAELYRKFQANDEELAVRYGVDASFLASNHALAVPGTLEYAVEGERPQPGEQCMIRIEPDCPMDLNVLKVVAGHMELSQSAVKRLCERGLLTAAVELKRARLTQPIELSLTLEPAAQE